MNERRGRSPTDFVLLPLQRPLAEAGLEVLQAQACYEGDYWNTTGIARHVVIEGVELQPIETEYGGLLHVFRLRFRLPLTLELVYLAGDGGGR